MLHMDWSGVESIFSGIAVLPWEKIVLTGTPIVLSVLSLAFVLFDRRARLAVRTRKGKWCELTPTMGTEGLMIFRGVIEAYNRSSRANAIRDYRFEAKIDGKWQEMESEKYRNTYRTMTAEDEEIFNATPLTLAPYSGVELKIQAFVPIPSWTRGYELTVRVTIEDLFGKRYRVEVTAQ